MTSPNEFDTDAILEDPKKYGLPTFEEFSRNPEKFLGRTEELLESVDQGGHEIRKFTRRHIYEIEGYRCKTLEEVQRVARSMGLDLKQMDYRPEVIPQGGGKCDVKVVFVSKERRIREVLR